MDDMETVFYETTKSSLYNHIKLCSANGIMNGYDKIVRPDKLFKFNRFGLFKSQGFSGMYNDILEPKYSLYRHEFTEDEITCLKNDVISFCNKYMTPMLAKSHVDYFMNQYNYPRGRYYASLLFDNFQGYGINNGKWSDGATDLWLDAINIFPSQINFSFLDKMAPIGKHLYDYNGVNLEDFWKLVLTYHPYLEILDQRKKGGFPHYKTTNVERILEILVDFDNLNHGEEADVGTGYFRTQGGKLKRKEGRTYIDWKIRNVIGSTDVRKISGSIMTYIMKLSQPKSTPYFKDGNVVAERVLSSFVKVYDQPDAIAFSTDISLNDQSHTNVNMVPIMELTYKLMSEQMDNRFHLNQFLEYMKLTFDSMKDSKVIWDVRQIQVPKSKKGLYKSLSGNPLVPYIETTSVLATHIASIALTLDIVMPDLIDYVMSDLVIDVLDQIDDFYYAGVRTKPGLEMIELIGKYNTLEYGLGTNVAKLEHSDHGYVTLLKTDIGKIYIDKDNAGCDLTLLDGTNIEFSILGGVSTKIKGLFDKERGNKDDGTPLFYFEYDDLDEGEIRKLLNINDVVYLEGKKVFGVTKDVQQLLGVLMSFGRKMPFELLDLIMHYFKGKEVYDKLLQVAALATKLKTKEKDFGFNDYNLLLKVIHERYR
jgi:hypothetical protein